MKTDTNPNPNIPDIDHNGSFWFIGGPHPDQVAKILECNFSGYLEKSTFTTDHLSNRTKNIADLLNRELFAPHGGIFSGHGCSAFVDPVDPTDSETMFEDADDSALLILAFDGGDLFECLSNDSHHPHDLFTMEEMQEYPELAKGPKTWQITQKIMGGILDIHNLAFVQDTHWYGSIISTEE